MKRNLVLAIGFVLVFVFNLSLMGCCENPNALKQVQSAFDQAQQMAYGADGQLLPNISQAINNPKVKEGVAAADLALSIGGALKDSYCATQTQAAQATAAATTAKANLAQ